MMLNTKWMIVLVCLAAASFLPAQSRKPKEENPYAISTGIINRQAKNFVPVRKAPVFKDAFSVGLVPIRFPDTVKIDTKESLARLSTIGGITLEAYYKDYSQGITWPQVFFVSDTPYIAPHPLGYYCEHHPRSNPLGYENAAEGNQRVAKLKTDANAALMRTWKRPAGLPVKADGKPHVIAHVYETALRPADEIRSLILPHYPNGFKNPFDSTDEKYFPYRPAINWADPLWPNSSVQINNGGDGGTLCHELGHVLGAPDFYHASEPHDGLPGTPTPWAFGPTGPGFCRVIHQAFLPADAYPMIHKDGTYTLHPRRTNPAGDKTLGAFIPSIHPNYLFCLEYVHGEQSPLGNPGKSGLIVQVINVTLPGPFPGPPDLCYTYRPGDPLFLGFGQIDNAIVDADFAPILPNQLPSGIELTGITENADSTLSFTLKRTSTAPLNATALKASLLPKIELNEVTEILPTSVYARATVLFRGEPLNTEYGFCYDTMPNPTCKTNNTFPLYHRDRYEGRILGLRPATTYHIRAYIKNTLGIAYSDKTLTVKTLPANAAPEEVAPLLTDKIGDWFTGTFTAKSSTYETRNATPIAFTKLAAYYRAPLDAETRTPAFDYTRIHTDPSESRPKFRMEAFRAALHTSGRLGVKVGLNEQHFTKTFDKDFAKLFGLRGKNAIEPFTASDIARFAPLIRAQIAQSAPVLAIQESEMLSPINQSLMPVIIDGYRGTDEFHLVYPAERDRVFNHRRTGWHPLTELFDQTTQVRLVFGLTPPSKRR